MPQKVYLDEQGNETKQYLDEQGNLPQTPTELAKKITPQPVKTGLQTISPYVRPLISSVGGLAGGPLGSASMAIIDQILDPASYEKSIPRNLADVAGNTILNEIGGRLLSGAGMVGSEALVPGSVRTEAMQNLLKLRPTTGQVLDSNVLKQIESTFAAKAKLKGLQESGKITTKAAQELLKQISGRSDISLTDISSQIANIEQDVGMTFKNKASLDKTILNPVELQKALNRGAIQGLGEISRKDLAAHEIGNILRDAQKIDSKGNIYYDPNALMSKLLDADRQNSYHKLFGSPKQVDSVRSSLETTLKNFAAVGPESFQGGAPQVGMRPYWRLRLMGTGLGLSAGLIGGLIADKDKNSPLIAGAGGAIVGGTIGLSGAARLMANKNTAKVVATLSGNGPAGMPIAIAGRMLASILKGEAITLHREDGSSIEGVINDEGKIAIPIK